MKTTAKVTATLFAMMAPTIATHANTGLQISDTSVWTDTSIIKSIPKIAAVNTSSSNLGKKIAVETNDGHKADTLADLLRQLGYSQTEVWGKSNKLEWAWHRINNAKFKRGEPVEFDGRTFIKNSI